MYLMYGDEADYAQNGGKRFLVCGAIFVDAERVKPLHDGVEAARRGAGFTATDSLKSNSNSKPETCTPETHLNLKNRVLELAQEDGVTFCGYVCFHEIARNLTSEKKVEYGFNEILKRFNSFLGHGRDSVGAVHIDRREAKNEFGFLQEKFQVGLKYPSGWTSRLERIVALSSTCNGASHLSSVADVVLGSFRYCVNEPDNETVGRKIYLSIANLMWKPGGKMEGNGLVLRPIESSFHSHHYGALLARLKKYQE
jgi:hypothetical protein